LSTFRALASSADRQDEGENHTRSNNWSFKTVGSGSNGIGDDTGSYYCERKEMLKKRQIQREQERKKQTKHLNDLQSSDKQRGRNYDCKDLQSVGDCWTRNFVSKGIPAVIGTDGDIPKKGARERGRVLEVLLDEFLGSRDEGNSGTSVRVEVSFPPNSSSSNSTLHYLAQC
jgi:hypothetical protein